MLNDADEVATTGPNGAEDVPVGAIQPRDNGSTVNYLTGGDDDLTVDETIEQGAMPAQMVATERPIEKLGEAKLTRRTASRIPGLTKQRMFRSGRFSPATVTRR